MRFDGRNIYLASQRFVIWHSEMWFAFVHHCNRRSADVASCSHRIASRSRVVWLRATWLLWCSWQSSACSFSSRSRSPYRCFCWWSTIHSSSICWRLASATSSNSWSTRASYSAIPSTFSSTAAWASSSGTRSAVCLHSADAARPRRRPRRSSGTIRRRKAREPAPRQPGTATDNKPTSNWCKMTHENSMKTVMPMPLLMTPSSCYALDGRTDDVMNT